MEVIERVARAIFDSTTAKARAENAHVAKWEVLPAYWREIHMRSARAAIAELASADVTAPSPLFVHEPVRASTVDESGIEA